MKINQITTNDLRKMNGKEGLILQGCGGEAKDWVDGINEMLKQDGILLDDTKFENVSVFENEGLTCILYTFDNVHLDVGKLAMWRLQSYTAFAGTWLTDYVDNKLGGFEEKIKPDCALIGQDGNIFNLMGIASHTLKQNRMVDEAKEMCSRITDAKSYHEALDIIGEYVNIIDGTEQSNDVNMQPRNLFKIDLTAFFPSISRDTVYRFFLEDMLCSPDVTCILTNLTTINLKKVKVSNILSVYEFLDSKNISCYNHLISGAPTSQLLSYLVNHRMFDEMQKVADSNQVTMTIYVDDVTFSSKDHISNKFKKKVISIIKKYNYQISKRKVKSYTKLYPKLVTGVIIDSSGKSVIKNSMRYKIMMEYLHLLDEPNDTVSRQRLRGLLVAARQVDKTAFCTIYKFAFS